jgi:hypothetical protein
MTPSDPKSAPHGGNRPTIEDYRLDLPFVVRQIRVCRSMLGAILEELEWSDLSPGAVEQFAACSTSVTAEIEHLWETIKQLHN